MAYVGCVCCYYVCWVVRLLYMDCVSDMCVLCVVCVLVVNVLCMRGLYVCCACGTRGMRVRVLCVIVRDLRV